MTQSNPNTESESVGRNEQTQESDTNQSVKSSSEEQSTESDDRAKNHEQTVSTSGTGGADGDELSLDQTFDILQNKRRRHVLRYLWQNDGETTMGTLAEHIAAIENDTTVASLSSAQRKRVYVALYQTHLPKMNSYDVVEFDRDRKTIRSGPNTEKPRSYLEDTSETS